MTTMKITVNIETNEPADLIRVANALAGVMPDPSTGDATKPATRRTTKTENPLSSAAAGAVTEAASTASAATAEHLNTQNASVAGATSPQTVSTGAGTEHPAMEVSEATLVAAANAAVEKLGPSGPAKVKAWIGANFQKDDGSPGTLKLTRADQRVKLLTELQQIAQGAKSI
jgi:hypothetical protein